MPDKITGTIVWYHAICPREAWLMAHEINPEQENTLLELGRLVQKESYSRKHHKKEVKGEGIKLDLLDEEDGKVLVREIKKSSRFIEAAKLQVAFYLATLKEMGIDAIGRVDIPKERKRVTVVLTHEVENQLRLKLNEILEVIKKEIPPEPKRNFYCKKCAYKDFCWV